MATYRDIIMTAQRKLTDKLKMSALCYENGVTGQSFGVYLRLVSEKDNIGDLAGTSLAYAERSQDVTTLVFLHAEHTPKRGNVYVIKDFGAYRVDHLDPVYGAEVTANVARLTEEEAANYVEPGE